MPLQKALLEVERKFAGLAVAHLTQHGGHPPFRSLRPLPARTIRDTYYDRDDRLSAAGTWIRRRNGVWGGKIRKGGDRTNSQFEEVADSRVLRKEVERVLGHDSVSSLHDTLGRDGVSSSAKDTLGHDGRVSSHDTFGLSVLADFVTYRQTWLADAADNNDNTFRIVLDKTDFGHVVGEVELEQELLVSDSSPEKAEQQKREAMQAMDTRIVAFLRRYAWAFATGTPTGKLTAYFAKKQREQL